MFQAGAYPVAVDLNDTKGQSVIDSLKRNAQGQRVDATYVHVDVSSYDSIHALFKYALDLYGRVDMAIYCAGITEVGGWFAPEADLNSITSVSVTSPKNNLSYISDKVR